MTRLTSFIAITALLFCCSFSSSTAATVKSKYPDGFVTLPVSSWYRLVSPTIMARTMRVHICEEGSNGWHVNGPLYFGGLGWLDATWQRYKASSFPTDMADATPQQQAWAMAHFVGAVFHGWWPDQNGCTGSY